MSEPSTPPSAAMLAYETPDDVRAVAEAAAVWRVAWWIGLLWCAGVVAAFGIGAGAVFAGDIESQGWARLPNASLYGVSVAALALAALALLLALLVKPRHRLLIAWLSTVAWLAAVFRVTISIMISGGGVGINGAGILSIPSAVALVLWSLFMGGAIVLAAVTWRKTSARGLALFVASVLIARPLAAVFDVLYWLSQGESLESQLTAALQMRNIATTASTALHLAAATLLIAASGIAARSRWPFLAAGVLVSLGLAGEEAQGVHSMFILSPDRFDTEFVVTSVGRTMMLAAPALALLFWRPIRATP